MHTIEQGSSREEKDYDSASPYAIWMFEDELASGNTRLSQSVVLPPSIPFAMREGRILPIFTLDQGT